MVHHEHSVLTYSTYSGAGRVGKTTTVANLAAAHARAGLKPLVVPLGPQDGDLPRLSGVDDQRTDSVDNIVRHMIRHPNGDSDDLIRTVEGAGIAPEHNMLSDLADFLQREKDQAEAMDEAFGMHAQLLRVLRKAGVPEGYDVLICDLPATEGPYLYNAIHATQSLVIPVEPGAKGRVAVEGLGALVTGFEDQLEIDVGVLVAVPTGFENTHDQRQVLAEIDYPVPEIINERASLVKGCWMEQCSALKYVRGHCNRRRNYEIETLAQFDRIARHLEEQAGIDAPNPPESGDVDHEVATV